MIKYAKILKDYREEKAISKNKLAKIIGTSHQNICRWENGEVTASIEFYERLADFYGISIDELVGRSWNDSTRIFNDIHHNQNVTINQKSK